MFGGARKSDDDNDEDYDNELGRGPWCALGSVKSMVGHTKAAAGISGG